MKTGAWGRTAGSAGTPAPPISPGFIRLATISLWYAICVKRKADAGPNAWRSVPPKLWSTCVPTFLSTWRESILMRRRLQLVCASIPCPKMGLCARRKKYLEGKTMPERTFTLLEVDLTNKKTQTVDVTEEVKKFLGGRSLGSKLLWDRVPPGAGPLGEDNILYFGVGPLTGLLGSVTNVTAKSPLTMLRGQSNMNGHFGTE